MGTINGKHFKEADTPTAAELNEVYDAVEVMQIDGDNTAANWATREHFISDKVTEEPLNRVFYFSRFASSMTVNSDVWTNVVFSSEVARVTVDRQAVNATILRCHWDTLVGELTFVDPGSSNQADFDYGFRLKVVTDLRTFYVAPGIYSFSARSIDTASSAINTDGIQWRSCSGTELVIINQLETVETVTLQAVVGNAAHSFDIDRYNITVVMARS